MAVKGYRVAVSTTPTNVSDGSDASSARSLAMRNRATESVYLGDSDVTTSTGYELEAGEPLSLDLGSSQRIYAVCATGPASLHVIRRS